MFFLNGIVFTKFNIICISAMASYLRILKKSPWWVKFQSREDMDWASTDIRYRKPKAVEAALSEEPCLPDLSDAGGVFLEGSIVTLSEKTPSDNANNSIDNDDFNRLCTDIDHLIDEEGQADEYIKKILSKPDGPVTTKYLKRCPLFWRDEPVHRDHYISAIEKIVNAEDNGIEYACLSCGKIHDIENESPFLKIIIGDSLIKHFFDGSIDGKDTSHFDYIMKSGLKNVTACREYLNLYAMEKKPQLIFVLLGTNGIMEGLKAEKLHETLQDFVAIVGETDAKHGRHGERRSRIFFGGIPQSPRICRLPNMGFQPSAGEWLSDKAVNLMAHNKNIESMMKELYPDFGTPSFHKVGWKSRKINKSGRRFYQLERREWRPHELPKALHWSDSEKCRVLKVIRKFLLEREESITTKIHEELSKVEFLPVGLDLDMNLENSMTEERNRTGSEQDPDGDEYVTADEDNEFDLIVSISNVEEAELV